MRDALRVFIRGLTMVTLVAMNTRQLASGRIGWAVIGGFFISLVWWSASSKDRPCFRGAGVVYGAGAAVGTGLGFYIAEWLGR